MRNYIIKIVLLSSIFLGSTELLSMKRAFEGNAEEIQISKKAKLEVDNSSSETYFQFSKKIGTKTFHFKHRISADTENSRGLEREGLEEEIRLEILSRECHCSWPGCGKSFLYPSWLKLHETVHSDTRNYDCPILGCTNSYKLESALDRHMDEKHAEGKTDYACTFPNCTKKYESKDSFNRHLKTHKNLIFKCNSCKMKPSSKDELEVHVNEHVSDGMLRCPYEDCLSVFMTIKSLDKHKKWHDGIRFRCNFCDRVFAQKAHLDRHEVSQHKSHDRR